jgi:endonuclease/exonuclease/phosphatase family metal-dependent hydrolase
MKKQIRLAFRILLLLIFMGIAYLVVILMINSYKDYRPENNILLNEKAKISPLVFDSVYAVLSWNIGYAGLNDKADFFYDGGTMVSPAQEDVEKTFHSILEQLNNSDSIPFIILQEVDTASSRSYYINQFREISRAMPDHHALFVKNYDVAYVPMPLLNPMGRVVSGLLALSVPKPVQSRLTVFPGNYSWPKKLFMPDRCFITNSYLLKGGKYLHVINTHNSAFDKGSLRKEQIKLLTETMLELHKQGDYVIAGGDWNINPPGFPEKPYKSADSVMRIPVSESIPLAELGWTIASDPYYPTNRNVSAAYHPGITPTTIIDFFVCSPNIRVLNTKTLYDGFKYSDHHPVYMRFKLMK